MSTVVEPAPTLHARLERQLGTLLAITKRWRLYDMDPSKAFKAITEAAAEALSIERASVWLMSDDRESLVCQDLYQHAQHRHSRGFKLLRKDHRDYFDALDTDEVVAATDAHTDPRTRSFRVGYLIPNGIGAMLDTPIRVGGTLRGVVCCEHVGESRLFMADEQTTARVLANMAALACEIQARVDGERKEKQLLALFGAAVDAADIGVYCADLNGDINYFNGRAQALYGFPDDLLVGKGTRENRFNHALAAMKDPDGVGKVLRKVLADPAAGLDSFPIELNDGRTLECSSRPQVVDGKIVGRVWTARDITDKQ